MPDVQPIGIDLGTTCSALACIDGAGRTAMIRSRDGEILTPSVVLFDGAEVLVGREAKKALGRELGRVAVCAKRDMGEEFYSAPIEGQRIPPEVIAAYILRQLKADAVEQLGPDVAAVITVPAFFDEARRKATTDAGEMAGLRVLDTVNEPTAAALAYGETLGYLASSGAPTETMRVLVYDLGGGTFDVTLLELRPGDLRTLVTDGDVHLGGHDWDHRLVDFAAEEFLARFGVDPREDLGAASLLARSVEECKHTLTLRAQAKLHVEYQGHTLDVPVGREQFESLTEDLLERTLYTCREVLRRAELEWSDVTRVLLVGGSTRMPAISRRLEELTGIVPDASLYPDEAVARGAAIYARYLLQSRGESDAPPSFQVADVNSHSLGILGVDQETGRRENVIVIPRNSRLPARAVRNFVTRQQQQQSVVVQVLEGESTMPEHCTTVGRAVVRHLPADLPQGHPIEVIYEYGANGRLAVRAAVQGTNRQVQMELERDQGLSAERLSAWKQVIGSEQGLPNVPIGRAVVQNGETAPRAVPRAVPTLEAASPAPSATLLPAAEEDSMSIRAVPLPAALQRASHGQAGNGEASYASSAATAAAQRAARRRRSMIVFWTGHLLAPILGLVIGYLVLCAISPTLNFLHLPIPWAK